DRLAGPPHRRSRPGAVRANGHARTGPNRAHERGEHPRGPGVLARQRPAADADRHRPGRRPQLRRRGGAGARALPVTRARTAVATWSHRFDGNRLLVTVTPFESGALPRAVYERTFDAVGQLLGASSVEV